MFLRFIFSLLVAATTLSAQTKSDKTETKKEEKDKKKDAKSPKKEADLFKGVDPKKTAKKEASKKKVKFSSSKLKVRIKDVTRMKGVEKYTLIGYGIVVGLNGTGDGDTEMTQRTVKNLLENFNIKVEEGNLKIDNIAAVMVTATINETAHKGDQLKRCIVSTIGDAESLTGGTLMLTPLLGSDGKIWATAQGPIVNNSITAGKGGAGGNKIQKNHPTVAQLTNGAKLLRDVGIDINHSDTLTLYLRNPDITTVVNIAESINKVFYGSAFAVNSSTCEIRVPQVVRRENRVMKFISKIEQLEFTPDRKAKIVFNERTGTIVIGSNVKISAVAISHGNIAINIKNIDSISQPSAFTRQGEATTVRINDEVTTVTEKKADLIPVPDTMTVGELVNVLNNLKVTPRDMMIIFHALRDAGALHAELESM
ncbi:MAG: flagellar basal body P-ring protein FlgI [Lentisphaeria bacterium]|nr:flagellar basal body P-ring protein FlgI [Lentisphaeria bacterium]NQZ70017.1 flagellar basal body P-ring protein FlgI [Lentisphaeria bacterium]